MTAIGRLFGLRTWLAAAALVAGQAAADALAIPFDFSRGEIALDVTVKGTPLFVLLDTGVDPSLINRARADSLGIKMDLSQSGEASGYGDDKSAPVSNATLDGLAIGGRSFGPIDTLVADTRAISQGFGREVDGVLGYSFLTAKIVLIDYGSKQVEILDKPSDGVPSVRHCRKRWMTAMQFIGEDNTPIIPSFRLGTVSGPITLDTGSNGGISLFDRYFALPQMKGVLSENGEMHHTGARGEATSTTYVLNAPVGFGPFSLAAGQVVNRLKGPSATDKRLANVGNTIFADMKLKILLNYRARKLVFYGDCDQGKP